MRVLIACLVMFVCCSCSDECDTPAPVITTEQVSITWTATSQGIPLAGYATVQIYSGNEYYEVQCTKKSFDITLKKGDYGYLSITPLVMDQAQNEAGVVCTYIMTNKNAVITQGTANGTNFLIK